MFGIARNLALNALKKIRHHSSLDDFQHLAANGGLANGGTERKDMIAKALLKLSPKHREVLDLVFYQGFIYTEIADILGTSVNTVKTRIFYAKKALSEILDQMGVKQDDI